MKGLKPIWTSNSCFEQVNALATTGVLRRILTADPGNEPRGPGEASLI